MGAWGSGFLENDTALDFVFVWDSYVAPCLSEKFWNDDKVWMFFRDIYFKNRFNTLDPEQNSQLLALAVLFKNNGLTIPDEFKVILERAANSELRRSALDEWSDPTTRKNELINLLKEEGLEKRRLLKSELEDSDIKLEIDKILPFIKRKKQMINAVLTPQADDDFEKYYPDFFNEIDKLLIAKIPRPIAYTEQEMQLIKLRLMLLAFYFGWKAQRCSPEELHKLMKLAEQTGGYFNINIEIFGED